MKDGFYTRKDTRKDVEEVIRLFFLNYIGQKLDIYFVFRNINNILKRYIKMKDLYGIRINGDTIN